MTRRAGLQSAAIRRASHPVAPFLSDGTGVQISPGCHSRCHCLSAFIFSSPSRLGIMGCCIEILRRDCSPRYHIFLATGPVCASQPYQRSDQIRSGESEQCVVRKQQETEASRTALGPGGGTCTRKCRSPRCHSDTQYCPSTEALVPRPQRTPDTEQMYKDCTMLRPPGNPSHRWPVLTIPRFRPVFGRGAGVSICSLGRTCIPEESHITSQMSTKADGMAFSLSKSLSIVASRFNIHN